MDALEFIRSHGLALPLLAKFALGMAVIAGVPALSRRVRLPAVVGLLLSGVVLGPHVLDVFGDQRPIADFFADLDENILDVVFVLILVTATLGPIMTQHYAPLMLAASEPPGHEKAA